jgi:hypothetical protein
MLTINRTPTPLIFWLLLHVQAAVSQFPSVHMHGFHWILAPAGYSHTSGNFHSKESNYCHTTYF